VQALASLQEAPFVLLPPSMQVIRPVAQEVTPTLQALGLVVQATPAVQATQAPASLQTMFAPQLVPAGLCALLPQTRVPVAQLVMPV